MKRFWLLIIALFAYTSGNCQKDTGGPIYNDAPNGSNIRGPLPADGIKGFLHTDKETILAYAILLCLLLILLLEIWVIQKAKIQEENAIKLFVITLVLMGTLFVLMVGYDEKVIAPIFGLFGTIVGYLFGKSTK